MSTASADSPATDAPAPQAGERAEAPPLTVGTAGHIDHGKTALVRALTGVDTDRLPEEKSRGITIVLGFAPLRLPGGRLLSLVDVPGHERLIRVMVAGATGIDLFLLTVAADDGVMPQTREHIRVLQALGVSQGVVAITKCDLADPAAAAAAATALIPGVEVVACCARSGMGVGEVAAALERVAAGIAPRSQSAGPAVLHIDRAFTVRGAGTVITGTLSSGAIARGERLALLPAGRTVRVRGLQVHDRPVQRAPAGQRVAVNLAGVQRRDVAPGDALVGAGARVAPVRRLVARLSLYTPLDDRSRVQLHHGTRSTPARAVALGDGGWELRCERPLIAADGDRVVLRRISPPDTIGGGVIVRAGRPRPAAQHTAPAAPHSPAAGTAPGVSAGAADEPARGPEVLHPDALALEQRLRAARHEPPSEAELGVAVRHLAALQACGRAVRIGRSLHAHPDCIDEVRAIVERIVQAEGDVTLARLRDELATSRRYAQALLEHLDAARVTLRLQDDSRVLRTPRDGRRVRERPQ